VHCHPVATLIEGPVYRLPFCAMTFPSLLELRADFRDRSFERLMHLQRVDFRGAQSEYLAQDVILN
jgi:hypothetical protein